MARTTESWVVDSLEDGVAALEGEDGRIIHVPARWLPRGCREGDWLRVSREQTGRGNAAITFDTDPEATRRARERLRKQVEELEGRDPGGDLKL
ncbi:MAG TPA: DUF3006 domain-containing protein [Longimicrobiales bacterium]|nr:DUF3006 domain-containing protein [Longimicrobiales bacterium]